MDNAQVFDANNDVVLFGGCLLDIVLNRQYCINDFDLRIVEEGYLNDEARCVAKAKEFVSSIFEYLKKENQSIDERIACAKNDRREWDDHQEMVKCNLQDIWFRELGAQFRCTSRVMVGQKLACFS